jgi:hypothetical protein
MNNTLKIGIIAGLIAGFIGSIVAIISILIDFNLGFPFFHLPPPPDTPISTIVLNEISVDLLWGAVLGIIFLRFYDAIPGKGILKGLVYGIILYLIYGIRTGTMMAVRGDSILAIVNFTSIHLIIYGLMLGILLKFLFADFSSAKEKLKIRKYDLKSGIHPGAIAGLIGGIAAFMGMPVASMLGVWPPEPVPPLIYIAALMTQDMVWGVVFGILFVMFYDKIPSKGIRKGIYFGLIFYFITSFRGSAYLLAYALSTQSKFVYYGFFGWTFTGFFHFIALGLVLGALYRKPVK